MRYRTGPAIAAALALATPAGALAQPAEHPLLSRLAAEVSEARLQAIGGDIARMGNFTPMQGMSLIASHGEKAEQYRKQAESLMSRARSEMRQAVSLANTAARTGNAAKLAEAAGHRQAAFDTLRQAEAEKLGERLAAEFKDADIGVFRVLCQLGNGAA